VFSIGFNQRKENVELDLAPLCREQLCVGYVDPDRSRASASKSSGEEGSAAAQFGNVKSVNLAERAKLVVIDREQSPPNTLLLPRSSSVGTGVLLVDVGPEIAIDVWRAVHIAIQPHLTCHLTRHFTSRLFQGQ